MFYFEYTKWKITYIIFLFIYFIIKEVNNSIYNITFFGKVGKNKAMLFIHFKIAFPLVSTLGIKD